MNNLKSTVLAAACLTAPNLYSAGMQTQKPNVLFFEVDDLMYKFVGSVGMNVIKTPNIDRLVTSGVYFSNAVCQGMMCGPSRNSFIAGLYPHNIGFYKNGQLRQLPNNAWTIAPAMKRAGYNTAWVGKCHVKPPRRGRKQSEQDGLKKYMGFDYAVASLGRVMLGKMMRTGKNVKEDDVYFEYLKSKGLYEQYKNDCVKKAKVTSLSEDDYLDGFYTNTALNWLRTKRDRNRPFFLWVNLSTPHGPFDVPQKYHDMYKNVTIPGPDSNDFGGVQIPAPLLKNNKPAKEDTEEYRKGYAANVTYMDTMLGKIISELKAEGVYDNTMIVFFSDHGIFMCNHGRTHKGTLFREILNPSLIISFPGKFQKGEIVSAPVELVSVLKTAMSVADAQPEDRNAPFGENLVPLLTGKPGYKTKYVFSEIENFQSCFDGRYHLITNTTGEKVLLYDLKNDPKELNDIAAECPEKVKELQKAVDRWFAETGPALPAEYLKSRKNVKKWTRGMRP